MLFKTLKIFLIILGLGVFILPKQMLFAQKIEQCCDKKSENKDCCTSKEKKNCHSENSQKNPEKNNCGNDCNNCHSCSLNFVLNYTSTEIYTSLQNQVFTQKLNFNYEISIFSSNIHNIWQPPKIA